MAEADIDGIATRYEVLGDGPPLLMFSPGGFDATIAKWRTQGIYARIKPLDHLPKHYTCIAFDRRETGESGGRVERITWQHFVAQGRALLAHLGVDRAHIMGACMGVCPAIAFAVAHPDVTRSLLLYFPVGGARYRINSHMRFAEHIAYVKQNGLGGVIELAKSHTRSFGEDPRGGPWVSVLRRDESLVDAYRSLDVNAYQVLVMGMARTLFDRDTAPGAEPEDLMRLDIPALVVPGRDAAHATSAARYLEECLPKSEYWDAAVEEQTESAASARMLDFLAARR